MDILDRLSKREISCLNFGFVKILDVMPRIIREDQTADSYIADAARISYGEGTKTINDDRNLIRHLMRNRHTSPFEMVEFKFHIKLPIFVMRQLVRHRTASISEVSGRYSVLPEEYFVPKESDVTKQSKSNRQGRGDELLEPNEINFILNQYDALSKICNQNYHRFLKDGLARELARGILPVNFYTECYWKIDLHNLLHFLKLRTDKHAQKEIQLYATAIENFVMQICPITYEAYVDYVKEAVVLSKKEVDCLRAIINEYKKEIGYVEKSNVTGENLVAKITFNLDRIKKEKLSRSETKDFDEKINI